MSDTSWQIWRKPPCVDMTDARAVAGDLARDIREFIQSDQHVSPAVVRHMEELTHALPDAEWIEDLSAPLASYDPWGGEGPAYYTTEELRLVLAVALPSVDAAAQATFRDAE